MKRFAVITVIALVHFAATNWLFACIIGHPWNTPKTPTFLTLKFTYLVFASPFIWIANSLPSACYSGYLLCVWFGANSLIWGFALWLLWRRITIGVKREAHT